MIAPAETLPRIRVAVEVPDGVQVRKMEFQLTVDGHLVQGDLYSESDFSSTFSNRTEQRHLFPDAGVSEPPKRYRKPRRPRRSLWKTFKRPDVQEALAAESKMEGYRTAVKQFCWWYRGIKLRSSTPELTSLDSDRNLLQKYFQYQLTRVSRATALNRLSGMTVVWRTLFELGYLQQPVPEIRKKRILKQAGAKPKSYVPIGIAMADAARLVQAAGTLRSPAKTLRLGDLSPRRFLQLIIGSSLFYGLNIGDVVPLKKKHNGGLHWSEVHRSPVPPFRGAETVEGARWDLGWIQLQRNKTGNIVAVPICPYMNELLQAVAGLDSQVCFPMPPECSSVWYRAMRRIKEGAGLYFTESQLAESEACNNPSVYDVSLSRQSPSRSCRKRAAILWKRHGNRSQASHILAHSTRNASVSDEDIAAANEVASETTERFYGGSEIYPDIVATAPKVFAEIESHLRLYGGMSPDDISPQSPLTT